MPAPTSAGRLSFDVAEGESAEFVCRPGGTALSARSDAAWRQCWVDLVRRGAPGADTDA